MTDAELNRLIAEQVMGYKLINGGGAGPLWETPEGRWLAPRNYCADPEAWAGLFVWLAEQKRRPSVAVVASIVGSADKQALWIAKVYSARKPSAKNAHTPGRALVLATLAAYGIKVTE